MATPAWEVSRPLGDGKLTAGAGAGGNGTFATNATATALSRDPDQHADSDPGAYAPHHSHHTPHNHERFLSSPTSSPSERVKMRSALASSPPMVRALPTLSEAEVSPTASAGSPQSIGHGMVRLGERLEGGGESGAVLVDPTPSFSPAKVRCSVGSVTSSEGESSTENLFRGGKGRLNESLLRLFRSEFFNPAMAMMYLYKYPDADVQVFLCEEMKKFPVEELEFFLPQYLASYIRNPTVYIHLRRFLLDTCSTVANFALLTIWQLRSQIDQPNLDASQRKHTTDLYMEILGLQPRFRVPTPAMPTFSALSPAHAHPPRHKGGHRRTKSDVVSSSPTIYTRVPMTFPPSPQRLAHNARVGELTQQFPRSGSASSSSTPQSAPSDLDTGHAFDWPIPRATSFPANLSELDGAWGVAHGGTRRLGARVGAAALFGARSPADSTSQPDVTIDTVWVVRPCLSAQQNFIKVFMEIGKRLIRFPRHLRRSQLFAELKLLNLNLPARVYLPLSTRGSFAIGSINGRENAKSAKRGTDHHVVRIPPREAVILNSKEKVPYLVQVEVLDCEDCQTSTIPSKLTLPRIRHTRHSSLGKSEDMVATDKSKPDAMSKPGSTAKTTPLAAPAAAAPAIVVPKPDVDFAGAAESEEAISAGQVSPADIRRRLSDATTSKSKFTEGGAADQSTKSFKEPWHQKVERIRLQSPYGHLPNWRLISCIVKCGDDLRQEQLASQLLQLFQQTWQEEKLNLWLRPLRILVTASDGGLLEVVGSAISLHQARKATGVSLLTYFLEEYGGPNTEQFITARKNFVESLAAYSLFCYFVQVKDRHNGNILIDGEGHILHIDFGFILSNSPRNLGFETAPFKLTNEFLEVMGGQESDMFQYFKILILQGFMIARKHMDRFVTLVEIMQKAEAQLPCFVGGEASIRLFEARFERQLTDEQLTEHVENLIVASLENMRTRLYDSFQRVTNGIM